MFRRTFTTIVAGACVASAQVSSSNMGNGSTASYPQRPLSFEDMKQFLELSDMQMQQLGKILDEQTSSSQGHHERLEAKRAELDALLRSGSRDVSRMGQLTLDIYTLSTEAPDPAEEWRRRAVAVLTPQQRAKLEPLQQAVNLAAAASQALAFNLLNAPPPPVSPLSPMPLLPDPAP